jgi:hypothetical protein
MNEGMLVAMELLWGFGVWVVEGEGGGWRQLKRAGSPVLAGSRACSCSSEWAYPFVLVLF